MCERIVPGQRARRGQSQPAADGLRTTTDQKGRALRVPQRMRADGLDRSLTADNPYSMPMVLILVTAAVRLVTPSRS